MELEKTTESKEDKEDKAKALTDKIDDAEAKTMELANQIEDLAKEINDLTKYIQEETDLRAEAKAENEATVKDAKDAQEAISNAIAVLTDFYKESGAFLQKGHREPVAVDAPPDTWESSYTGLDKQPDGILSMLETIMQNFADLNRRAAEIRGAVVRTDSNEDFSIHRAKEDMEDD